MKKIHYRFDLLLLSVLLIILSIFMLFPIYLVFINGIKPYNEVMQSLLTFPKHITLLNYEEVWVKMNYPRAFINSLAVTIISVLGVLFISSTAAYRLVRSPGIISNIIFYAVLSALIIPFQIIMVPALKVAKDLALVNTSHGLIFMYWGFLVPSALFLYHGFIKSIPYELEEAALIDGCGPFKMFYKIVLPLLMPITMTIAIIKVLAVYNDFMLPLIMISSNDLRTLPLAVSVFFGNYANDWNLIMASLSISILPIILFFLFMQRYIVQGLVAGAVKG